MQSKFILDERYQIIKKIGQGSYGLVFDAKDIKNQDQKVVLKHMQVIQDTVDAKRNLREIRILKCLQHQNIITLQNIVYQPAQLQKQLIYMVCMVHSLYVSLLDIEIINSQVFGNIYLVIDKMDTDLERIIQKKKVKNSEAHVKFILYQILRSIYYVHSANVVHRDIKPSNILINSKCEVKLTDFGLSRTIVKYNEDIEKQDNQQLQFTEYVVTRFYRAPEIMLCSSQYTEISDIWSLGCLAVELITGEVMFSEANYINQIKTIFEKLGQPEAEDLEFVKNELALKFINSLPKVPQRKMKDFIDYSNDELLDLIDKMLVINPEKRISAEQAMKHKYFKQLYDAEDEPSFQGQMQMEFENDPNLTLETVLKLIIEEINFFKTINQEPTVTQFK